MTKAELIAEKSTIKTELQLLRQQTKGVFTSKEMEKIRLELEKINTRMSLIDKEIEILTEEELFSKEQNNIID